jgi:hypothetical protein
MEVHHHPNVEKKNFKEYFFEFIMIFLAVTLGFFAETIREKITENHREKIYIAGLINNAQNDTANLRELIAANDLELSAIDSLLKISKNNSSDHALQDSIFFYALAYTINLHIFSFNDLTLVQLRNAGGYSLIRTGSVADTIALYVNKNNDITLQERFYTDAYLQVWTAVKQVFDVTQADKFFQAYKLTNKIPPNIPVLISSDGEKMHVLLNNYWTFSITLNGYNQKLKGHLEYLKKFIAFLKQNYDIE